MTQLNIRGLDDDQYARLQEAAAAEGVSVTEFARRVLTAYPGTRPGPAVDIGRTVTEADQAMIRGGIPIWTRKKVLEIFTGGNPVVPGIGRDSVTAPRRENRRTHLDANIVPVENALLYRAEAIETHATDLKSGVRGTHEQMTSLREVAAEFRALAEELHYW